MKIFEDVLIIEYKDMNDQDNSSMVSKLRGYRFNAIYAPCEINMSIESTLYLVLSPIGKLFKYEATNG